jgi:hypothetical protein
MLPLLRRGRNDYLDRRPRELLMEPTTALT